MMISPESYVEFEIKGKSREDISKEIRSLKRELEALKSKAENEKDFMDVIISPSLDVRMDMTREYLEASRRYLRELGYEYPETKAEQRTKTFDDNIPYIEMIHVQYERYRGGGEERKVSHEGNTIKVLEDYSFSLPVKRRGTRLYKGKQWDGLLEDLKTVHMGEWRSRYVRDDVLDGYYWKIVITYNNGTGPRRFSGSNKYPFSFEKFMEIMEIRID